MKKNVITTSFFILFDLISLKQIGGIMAKKYDTEEIGVKFRAYIQKNFSSSTEAAKHYDCSPQSLSNTYSGNQAPNKQMLNDMGYKKVKQTWFEKL